MKIAERIEPRLTGNTVLCSVYIDDMAKVTVEVRLPEGVRKQDEDAIKAAVEQAVNAVSPAVHQAVSGD